MRISARFGFLRALLAAAIVGLSLGAAGAPRKTRTALFCGEVIRFDSVPITVRSRKEPLVVRSFTYSPKVRERVIRVLGRNGYEYGDRVQIRYEPGHDVALAIHGKPSKPAHLSEKRK